MSTVYSICDACGYVGYDIPRDTDNAHDQLCCGTKECSWRGNPKEVCATHEWYPAFAEEEGYVSNNSEPQELTDNTFPTDAPNAVPIGWNSKFYFWCPVHLKHLYPADDAPRFFNEEHNDTGTQHPTDPGWELDLSFVECTAAHEADDHSCREHWEVWAAIRDA